MEPFECKIMAVDDHMGILKMIDAILRENGYTKIISAGDAKEAMGLFLREQPDMVILDIMLPGEDGFSLFGKIRGKSDVPILFLSAKDEDADRIFGLGLGADDYMTKPFLPEELASGGRYFAEDLPCPGNAEGTGEDIFSGRKGNPARTGCCPVHGKGDLVNGQRTDAPHKAE